MNELIEKMKVVLASTFAFYLKSHGFHWNVEGVYFPQLHSFFETIYTDAWKAVDKIAEEIRTLDAYAPGSLSRLLQLSVVEDQINIPTALKMVKELEINNNALINELRTAQKLAEKTDCVGLANFLQDRIDKHHKHAWMLRSITKS